MSILINKKSFCIPKYLSMPVIGLNIDNSFLRYLELDFNKKNIEIKKNGEFSITGGIIKDGEILNKEKLISILKEVRRAVSTDFVNVAIPEDKNYIFNIKIPRVKDKEIRQILEFKIEENVPLKLSESVFEYEVISSMSDEKELFLNVTVVPKKIIEDYTEVIKASGFYPLSFEAESKMVSKSVIPKNNKDTFIILNMKDDSTILSMVSNNIVLFTSTISIGSNLIIDSLYKKNKNEKVIKLSDEMLDINKDNNERFDSLLNIFSVFKDEINKFIKYWILQDDKDYSSFDKKISKIIVCGRTCCLSNFSDHIVQGIDIQVSLADVWVNVFDKNVYLPELKFTDSLDYSVPVGLILSSYNKKNA